MEASFGYGGNIKEKGPEARPATAEGLGGCNIKGNEDPKTSIPADQVGKDAEEAMKAPPITTGRAPVAHDPAGDSVVTMEDPGKGNTKTAAGNATSAGNPKMALPGQTGK